MRDDSISLRDRGLVMEALRQAEWIISQAARDLGVSRQGLKKAIKRHGITRRASRAAMAVYLSKAGRRGGRPRKPPEAA